jgi:hypothetical protein
MTTTEKVAAEREAIRKKGHIVTIIAVVTMGIIPTAGLIVGLFFSNIPH